MRLRPRPPDEVGFQLAPMIDITFLLLIFFMVTTKITRDQVKVDIRLPVASNAVIPRTVDDRDLVTVDAAGHLFSGSRPVTDAQLAAHLKRRLADYPPLRIYVRADRGTPAKRIKEVMRLAADAGAVEVIFGSHQNE
jgi:biopolymer transport protein ExbD